MAKWLKSAFSSVLHNWRSRDWPPGNSFLTRNFSYLTSCILCFSLSHWVFFVPITLLRQAADNTMDATALVFSLPLMVTLISSTSSRLKWTPCLLAAPHSPPWSPKCTGNQPSFTCFTRVAQLWYGFSHHTLVQCFPILSMKFFNAWGQGFGVIQKS